jgi:NAD(P)-dependent dehydrogenase (short-subunit alcohol dehydrogenase family)
MPHWTPAEMPDLAGRVAMVTGASSGIGFHTALELARRRARTLLACRDVGKAEQALERITEAVPEARGSVEILLLDLASLESVQEAATELADRTAVLDILVNNAGVMVPGARRTADGYELQFGTNHIGHFALTGRLLPLLLAADQPRVVTVSSVTHRRAKPEWDFEYIATGPDSPDTEALQSDNARRAHPARWSSYGRSKLANLVFARELDRRVKRAGSSLVSVAAHPGYAATGLMGKTSYVSRSAWTGWLSQFVVRLTAQSSAVGAWPSLYGATARELCGGEFVGPRGPGEMRGAPRPVRGSRTATDEAIAKDLWEKSVAATGVGYEELRG